MVRQDREWSPLLIEHENLDDKIYTRLKGMIADGSWRRDSGSCRRSWRGTWG